MSDFSRNYSRRVADAPSQPAGLRDRDLCYMLMREAAFDVGTGVVRPTAVVAIGEAAVAAITTDNRPERWAPFGVDDE